MFIFVTRLLSDSSETEGFFGRLYLVLSLQRLFQYGIDSMALLFLLIYFRESGMFVVLIIHARAVATVSFFKLPHMCFEYALDIWGKWIDISFKVQTIHASISITCFNQLLHFLKIYFSPVHRVIFLASVSCRYLLEGTFIYSTAPLSSLHYIRTFRIESGYMVLVLIRPSVNQLRLEIYP